ncbi:MAG: ABC transporter permease [Christensenellales bacterium]
MQARRKTKVDLWKRLKVDWQLYVLILPVAIYFFVFNYLPLYGIQIAFRDYKAVSGITGSKWVGMAQFTKFFSSYYCGRLFANTFLLNFYNLLIGFPVPLLLSLLINQMELPRFKKFSQTIIYVPYFISTVVLAGMLYIFFSPSSGIVNKLIVATGGESIYFINDPRWFRTLFIGSNIWQSAGWNTILYIAALTSIDTQIYEAATIDGATKLQKIRYIDIPSLLPTATMVLILNSGSLLNSNTQKALLLQTPGNTSVSDIMGVYVYNIGLGQAQYSYTAAIGLCLNIINFVMILSVNMAARKLGEVSLF